MKVYVTKYAMTQGILGPFDVIESNADEDKYVFVRRSPGAYKEFFSLGTNAFECLDDAKDAAEAMRQKKLASLRKSIAKIEALKF